MRGLDEYISKAGIIKINYSSAPKAATPGKVIIKNPAIKVINRRKHIFVEDSQKTLLPHQTASNGLSCRNPFRMDDTLINYELDTEDELEEENGEDLNDDNNVSDDNEEDLNEQEL